MNRLWRIVRRDDARAWFAASVVATVAAISTMALTSGKYGFGMFGVALVGFVVAAYRWRRPRPTGVQRRP
jgi:hypothetical protein